LGDGEITFVHTGGNFRAAASIRYGDWDIVNNKMMIPFIRRLQVDLGWEALSALLKWLGKEPQNSSGRGVSYTFSTSVDMVNL